MTESTLDINKYNKIELIGRGGFGDVFKIQDKKTKEVYAAKVAQFELTKCTKEDIISITREVNILNQIVHASVIQFVGYSQKWFEGKQQPVIVTEFCKNGSLQDIIELERRCLSHESWDETKKLINIYGIASGMSYLHSHNIIHRDLKPGNILMDCMLFPKIADFGLSKIYTQNPDSTGINSTTGVKGTLIYIAPEIFESNEYSSSSDVYAFGFIVYEIMTNEQPHKGLNQVQIMKKVLTDQARPSFDVPIPSAYRSLIERCWSQNPSDRPSFPEIVDLLKTEEFITDTIISDDFQEYINYIDEFHNEFKMNNKILHVHDYIKAETKTFRNVTVKKDGISYDTKTSKSSSSIKEKSKSKGLFSFFSKKGKSSEMIYPKNEFKNLDERCQALVTSAIEDVDACIQVGQNLIENKENFPQNTGLGIKYLKSAHHQGSREAAFYLSKLFYKGDLIPQDLNKSKKYIKKYIKGDNMEILTLYAKISKKEGNYTECFKYLRKACEHGCGTAMYEYGKLLYRGEGISSNQKEAKKYFEMAQRNGNTKANKFLTNNEPKLKQQNPSISTSIAPKAVQSMKVAQPTSKTPEEKNKLGENLLNGNGVSKNLKEAARLFKEASQTGHIRASYNLGMCYLKELGVPIDLYESVKYFKKAVDGGDTDAMEELGQLYLDGIGVIQDQREAVRLFRLGANKGHFNCARRLSKCYCDETGVEKDYDEAVRLIQPGVRQNDPASLNFLGISYYLGEGVEKDYNKSNTLIKRAADMGFASAISNLGGFYIEGDHVEQDVKKGIQLYKQAAEIPHFGGVFACRNLAKLYKEGKYANEDVNEAMHYYRLAASYNDIQSINEIDVEFPTNIMPNEDRGKALNDIRSGHDRGVLYYAVSLGMCYEYGEGVRKDLNKAYELYKEASSRGSQRGIFRLGLFYEKGIIVKKDMKEAIRLYKISSDWGYTMATFQLALCYKRGIGVRVDKIEADRLYGIAFDRKYNAIYEGKDDVRYQNAVIADEK